MSKSSLALVSAITATVTMSSIAVAGAGVGPSVTDEGAQSAAVDRPAQPRLVVGPGDPIRNPLPEAERVEGRFLETGMCSSSIPGTVIDSEGKEHRVQLTAGHCVNQIESEQMPAVSTTIYAPTKEHGDVRIGELGPHSFDLTGDSGEGWLPGLDGALNGDDWAFIILDDDIETSNVSYSRDEYGRNKGPGVQMEGIEDYSELQRGEISFDNFAKPICKDGSRTGRSCGYQIFRVRNGVWAVAMEMDQGDSGGNAYNPQNNHVIGVNSMAVAGIFYRVQPVDVAIEEAYGIEDGKVNEHFKVTDGTGDRSETYRSIQDDQRFVMERRAQEQIEQRRQQIEEVLPFELPESPALPQLPQEVADIPVPGFTNVDRVINDTISAANNVHVAGQDLLQQAGVPSLF